MIGMITGQVVHLSAPVVCVMTTSGVGYEVELPIQTFCQMTLGEMTTLHTHLVVREDAQLLYGFIGRTEREVFRRLLKITGVGAKMALAILSTLSLAELKRAAMSDNEDSLVRVPGIGKKTAQRLIIELKDKLSDVDADDGMSVSGELFGSEPSARSQMQIIAEVESALMSLGYKEKEAQAAIKAVDGDVLDDTQKLLKAALKQLSGF